MVAEKMVSGKDGTVTQQMHYGNTSANVASTKYQDDFSSGGLKSQDDNVIQTLPQGVQSASIVHTTLIKAEIVNNDNADPMKTT